jgi:nucleoside-diphosphate-sugar epimerase
MAAGAAARAVLVIGAQGVLGTALVRAFEEAGWRVLEACGEVMAPAAPPSWTSTAPKPWRRRSPALTRSLIPCRIPS